MNKQVTKSEKVAIVLARIVPRWVACIIGNILLGGIKILCWVFPMLPRI